MSIEAMNAAYKAQVGSPIKKAILVALANQADQDGKCWPSIDYIAERTEVSRRAVINNIQSLCEMGLLERQVRPGEGEGRKSNLYKLNFDKLRTVKVAKCRRCTLGKVHEVHGQSASGAGQSARGAPKQSITIKEQSIERPRKRGSRLPPDWTPSEKLLQWAWNERPDLDMQKVIDTFTDHWRAKTGKDATKLDWDATFRNWVRNERSRSTTRETPAERRDRLARKELEAAGFN